MSILTTKKVCQIIIIFVIGTIGGIFADQILWPYFIERPLFYQYRLEQAPVNVVEKQEIFIQENSALEETIKKIEKAIVGIKTITAKKEEIQGSGIIITSDGLVLTLAELLPKNEKTIIFMNDIIPDYTVIKKDEESNLALIKIEQTNLSTISFVEIENLKLGKRVFLLGVILNGKLEKVVNQGIIRNYSDEIIQTNIIEQENLKASPLFDIEGKLIGLSVIDEKGQVSAIPISKIREFIGF
ncbi:MAG: serine protease [Candidatus Nealsonbacteria bacterium]